VKKKVMGKGICSGTPPMMWNKGIKTRFWVNKMEQIWDTKKTPKKPKKRTTTRKNEKTLQKKINLKDQHQT